VCLEDRLEFQVFPELVSISQFTIGEAMVVIMLQRVEIGISVIGEVVCKAVIATVAIAENDEFGSVVEGNSPCVFIGTRESSPGGHVFRFSKDTI
jgi:hypothetical protein